MIRFLQRRKLLIGTALAVSVVGGWAGSGPSVSGDQTSVSAEAGDEDPLPEVGLMGTIPIYWGEAEELGDILGGTASPHWARAQLEQHYHLRPLAALTAEGLQPLRRLILAQPRALAPEENVALDNWVRSGGRVLLFADPFLTGESQFSLGDPRRPQDVVLLSPILNRWGLELQFVEDQPAGPQMREIAGQRVPANLPGRFAADAQGGCIVEASGLLADCRVGEGRVVALADATVLDMHDHAPESSAALQMLVDHAFTLGEIATSQLQVRKVV